VETSRVDEQLFGIMADRCSEAMFAVDLGSFALISANRAFCELVARPSREVIGASALELMSASADTFDRPGLHEDVVLPGLMGPVFLVLTVAHVDDPRLGRLAVCIARDTTERRLLERELLSKHMALYAAHGELERAIAVLEVRNRQLSSVGAQLSLAARRALIGELSAGIAHSLNNPLAALASTQRQILGLTEKTAGPEVIDAMRRYSARSADAIGRMEAIIQSIRQTHKSGHSNAGPRQLDLGAELDVALAIFEARLGTIEVVRDASPCSAWGPPGDLQHVLWNLIDNAIQAMPAGGVLGIGTRQVGELVTISVEDSGLGVDQSLMSSLFQPFNSTRTEGSGLGLCTARRLARLWGGDVVLAPTVAGRGARFEITIPAKESECPGKAS